MKRLLTLLLAAVMLLSLLSACGGNNNAPSNGGASDQTPPSQENQPPAEPESNHVETLRIGTLYANDTFSAYSQSGAYGRMNYNGLSQLNFWRRDSDESVTGEYCFFNSWDISEDNTQLTLHFDKLGSLYFHDGEPVTIDDVVFSFEFYKGQKSSWFLKITDIEVLDETSIRLTFDSNYAFSFLNEVKLQYYILPKHIWENVEDPAKYTGEDAAIGCGPYKLVKIDADAQVSYYEAVENYPIGGELTVDKVELRTYDSQSALVMAMVNGEIDAMYAYSDPIDTTLLPLFENDANIDRGESMETGPMHIVFGFNQYPTNDLPFRQAVRKALDYDLLRDSLTGGYGIIANEGAVSPMNMGYLADLPELGRDLEAAASILEDAGYVDVDSDGFRELPDGGQMDVKIALQSGSETYKRIAEILTNNLAEAGIRVSVDEETISNSDYTNQLRNDGAYEIYIGQTTTGRAQWTGVVNYVADIMSNKKWGTYGDQAYLDAYNGMLYATSYEDYIRAFQTAQRINSEQCPVICLAIANAYYPYRTDAITGWEYYPAWGVINNATWYTVTAK